MSPRRVFKPACDSKPVSLSFVTHKPTNFFIICRHLAPSFTMSLPPYDRPWFIAPHADPEDLGEHIRTQTSKYNNFINNTLYPSQRDWARAAAEAHGIDPEHDDAWMGETEKVYDDLPEEVLDEFYTYPCLNDPTMTNYLERIMTELNSDGAHEVRRLLYTYMPLSSAQECRRKRSLSYIPDYMRFVDHDDSVKLLVLDIPPKGNDSKDDIVRKYHAVGCTKVERSDIAGCVVIPDADFIAYDEDNDFFKRARFGSFDVVAVTKVLLEDR
ncbi:RolB family protein [Mesorhizobium sp. ORM16]|uniref:RolB family protein n=1 Tax=Mesorhizobium sp. ORM16 TaxID=3376989 RepID=UPI003857B5C0